VQALRDLMATHGFGGADINTLQINASPKVLSHHNRRDPADVMQAQYSLPFCVALAAWREPLDPAAWNESAVADPQIRALCQRIELRPFAAGDPPDSAWHTRLTVTLHGGRRLEADARHFRGMPEQPLDDAGVAAKFLRLAQATTDKAGKATAPEPAVRLALGGARGSTSAQAFLARLMHLESEPDLSFLHSL
jgi:2-methylcitrate dehydratase PrpD